MFDNLPNDEVIKISFLVNNEATIEYVEQLAEKAFINMGCIYYELYEN